MTGHGNQVGWQTFGWKIGSFTKINCNPSSKMKIEVFSKKRFSLSEINSIADSKDLLCLESENSSNARFLDLNKMILDFPSEISKITDYLGPELGALSNYYLTSSLFNDGFFLKSEPNTRSKQFFTVVLFTFFRCGFFSKKCFGNKSLYGGHYFGVY